MASAVQASAGPDVFLELRAELRDVGLDRPGRGVREHTDRLALHVAGDRQQIVEVLKPSLALGDTAHDPVNPAGSLPARRTLAARLVGEELGRGLQGLEHARGLIHHDHAAGAGHRAGRHQESKSMRTSISSAVSTFAEMPPGMTALSLRPHGRPSA